MKRKPLVYISGPYTIPNPVGNTRRAISVADEILRIGMAPLVPHLNLIWDFVSPKSYDTWLRLDLQQMIRCDAVFRIPGESKGAEEEIRVALENLIPVFYTLDSLRESFGL